MSSIAYSKRLIKEYKEKGWRIDRKSDVSLSFRREAPSPHTVVSKTTKKNTKRSSSKTK